MPKCGYTDGSVLHSLFSIPTRAIPDFKKLKIDSLNLLFPFRHDGGSANYILTKDGSIDELKVEPPQPTDEWPYPNYPQAFEIARYESSKLEPIDGEVSLRLLHQKP